MSLVPTSTPLTHFRLLSFDVYGTLVDSETGVATALLSSPHLSSLPSSHAFKTSRKALLTAFAKHERAVQAAHPGMLYSAVLGESYKLLVAELSNSTTTTTTTTTNNNDNDGRKAKEELDAAATAFSNSNAHWPAFPDTVAALQSLSRRYKLAPLTNTDNRSLGLTLSHALAGAPFSAAYTAQDIGSYKPDRRNFFYLLDRAESDFGIAKDQILHVAESLWHDHIPAAELGLESVWVDRGGVIGGLEEAEGKARFAWRVGSLGELAERVEVAFGEREPE